jgi:hypothetical protein
VLKDIKDYYGSMELADPKFAALPEDDSPAIELLTILDGYSCAACRHLTVARDNIVHHWREAEHGVATIRWTEVRLQTWMGGRKHARYWIIRDCSDVNNTPGAVSNNAQPSSIEKIIAASQARLKAEEAMRLRKGDLEEDIDRDSAWVKRLGWVRHFSSRDL